MKPRLNLSRPFPKHFKEHLAALIIGVLFATSALGQVEIKQYQIEGVIDGDTLHVRDPSVRASYRVRLAMIDAPEKAQTYGIESKSALQQLLRGQATVTLHVYDEDRYNRLIAVVVDERGRNINLELVNQGAAWVYDRYARARTYSDLYPAFVNAQNTARARQLGLWRSSPPTPPWEFRRK